MSQNKHTGETTRYWTTIPLQTRRLPPNDGIYVDSVIVSLTNHERW
jgi:hypothetical protein